MLWLLAASAACVLFCAAAFGTFVPLRDPSGIQYLFAAPSAPTLLAASAGSIGALAALFLIVNRVARRRAPLNTHEARSGRWLAPITVLSIVVLGIAPAVPGIGELAAPAAYFFYDLRWWWVALMGGLVVADVDRLLGGPISQRIRSISSVPDRARRRVMDAVLFLSVMLWATATTPALRFSGTLTGDEPKYLRYCELWYQGGGFDISAKQLLTELPADTPPASLKIVGLLVRSLGEDALALGQDLRGFLADPLGFRWNRAAGDDGFLTGKRGGVYQVYQPGLSAILFPGYLVDRYVLTARPGYQNEFPAGLVMTNLMMLLVYGACAVAMCRLLRHALGSDDLAFVWAAIAMLTLPTTAFAFQFYPETPALLIIASASTFVLFHATRASPVVAGAAGAAAGSLVWLHPRFLLVSVLLLGMGLMRIRGDARRTFAASWGAVFLTLTAFDYHVTGSFSPTALWDATTRTAFNLWGVPSNLLGYALHRTSGVVPPAPVLLAVVPGLAVLGRQSPTAVWFLAAMWLALGIPAAGHTLAAAGTTSGRLVLAVVPLAAWPIAALVRRFWSSAAMRSATVVLVVLSLDAALAYNWSHQKHVGSMRDASASGWKPNLAFPVVRDDGWTTAGNVALIAAIAGIVAAASILAWQRSAHVQARAARFSSWIVSASIVATTVLLASAASAASGDWFNTDYLMNDAVAREEAARGLLAGDRCRVCFTSRKRTIDWRWLEPNAARGLHVDTSVDGHAVTMRARVEDDGLGMGFGRLRVDFGDGSAAVRTAIVGSTAISHRYERAGEHPLTVWLDLRDGSAQVSRQTVRIGAPR